MRAKTALFLVLLVAPAFAGCTLPGQPKGWDLEMTLGVLVSPRAGDVVEDVSAAVDLAARQWNEAGVGIHYDVESDPATDSVAAAYDRLVKKGAAAIVAAVAPNEARAVAQRAVSGKVPLLLVTPPDSALSNADAAQTLVLAADRASEGGALATLAHDNEVERVVMMRTSDAFANLTAAGFDRLYNGTILETGVFARDTPAAIGASARAICATDADGVVILAPGREAGWIVRGLVDAGCYARLHVLAASSARQNELVEEAGKDGTGRSYAEGVLGVEPENGRLGEFRALFLAETGRIPGAYAAEAHDAVSIATLAAFHAKSSQGADPVRATITANDIRAKILPVAGEPGINLRDIPTAANAAKIGEELDWVGYAHDYDFSAARAPVATAYDRWTVTRTGAIEGL